MKEEVPMMETGEYYRTGKPLKVESTNCNYTQYKSTSSSHQKSTTSSADTSKVEQYEHEGIMAKIKHSWKNLLTICKVLGFLIIVAVAAVFGFLLKSQFSLSEVMQFSIGLRNDYLLQDCHKSGLKRTFPDLGYVLLGYNILKGYPLANGHDPGLTKPIFKADYKKQQQSADCKFSIPDGYTVIPDVSCEVSFSSTVIRSMKDLEKSMSASAQVSGGGFGVSFSASAEYKKHSRTIESDEKTMIITTATCQYYFAEIDDLNPPPFSDSFIKWLEKLDGSNDDDDFLDFLEYYGTHYLKSATFGARFMKEHTLDTSKFQELEGSSISVQAQASYSGLFSVGGGFGFSDSQKQAVENFNSKVETVTTTVGSAPPSDGDASTWASTVKETPVPFRYKFGYIEDLLSETFMHRYQSIDWKRLKETFASIRQDESMVSKINQRMVVDSSSCRVHQQDVHFEGSCLGNSYQSLGKMNRDRCYRECFDDVNCLAHSLKGSHMDNWKILLKQATDITCLAHKTDGNHELKLESCENKVASSNTGHFFIIFPRKMKLNSKSYVTGEIAGKLFLKHIRMSTPGNSNVQPDCSNEYSYSDKCADACIADDSCTIAHQVAKGDDGVYCCYLHSSEDFQSASHSIDVNEYLVFIKTRCQ